MLKPAEMEQVISRIVDRISESCKPQKIILFGSYAKGAPTRDSDIDLLIVKDSKERRDMRDQEIRRSLGEIMFPLDIFVYTPEEIEKFYNLPGSFIHKIFKEGRVLYEQE